MAKVRKVFPVQSAKVKKTIKSRGKNIRHKSASTKNFWAIVNKEVDQ